MKKEEQPWVNAIDIIRTYKAIDGDNLPDVHLLQVINQAITDSKDRV